MIPLFQSVSPVQPQQQRSCLQVGAKKKWLNSMVYGRYNELVFMEFTTQHSHHVWGHHPLVLHPTFLALSSPSCTSCATSPQLAPSSRQSSSSSRLATRREDTKFTIKHGEWVRSFQFSHRNEPSHILAVIIWVNELKGQLAVPNL
jgi:hypothetical protein